MRDTRALSFTLATGALARATPRLELEASLLHDSHDPSRTHDEEESIEGAKISVVSRGRWRELNVERT
jgi:hypothetical protein